MSDITSAIIFDNIWKKHLRIEADSTALASHATRQVHDAHVSLVSPEPTSHAQMISMSSEAAGLVGLDPEAFETPALIALLSGNGDHSKLTHFASCYGGHQFGHWAGQLGDGRAMSIGDIIHNKQLWEIQLKGAGRTPYSRAGDGRAVLRSSIREYIASEAMHYLGVPTTRAMSLCLTGDTVIRDMFYDGSAGAEPSAIVSRLAPSFVRFGNFELFASRQHYESLKELADFTIKYHVPQLADISAYEQKHYRQWFQLICEHTALLMVEWHRVGFVHGVMNTDNMSILGLTIDYGPFAFLDGFDAAFTPNTSDKQKRYCFGSQAPIAHWNLMRLGDALRCLLGDDFDIKACLDQHFVHEFNNSYRQTMLAKLGLTLDDAEADMQLIDELTQVLSKQEIDMTLFFSNLSLVTHQQQIQESLSNLLESFYDPHADTEALSQWLIRYQQRITTDALSSESRKALMQRTNPAIIPRNYLLQEAINDAEQGNYLTLNTLLTAIKTPYASADKHASKYRQKRPEWARYSPGCGALSCSS